MNSTLISIVAVILLAGAIFAGPIHDAALNGVLAGVQAELDKGVDVNAKGEEGWTPLHSAATKEIAELLIAKGADVNAKSDDGTTPLDVAIELKRTGIVNLLRKHGGKTGEEFGPRLEYGKNQWPFDFSFTAKREKTYAAEVTQDFKQCGDLETIKGYGKQVKFIVSRNTAEILLQQHTAKHGGFGIRTWAADGGDLKSFDETKVQYEILSPPEFAERLDLDYPIKQYYRVRWAYTE